eukprot:gene13400-17968_t
MSKKCRICTKSVYPMDPQINLDGSIFHKPCAKCNDCNCQITISNFCKNESGDETTLLCKTHYFKRFHEGGAYLGGEKFQNKSARDIAASGSQQNNAAIVDKLDSIDSGSVNVNNSSSPEEEIVQAAVDPVPVQEVDALA